MAMAVETERYHWRRAQQNLHEAEHSGSAHDRSWRAYAAVEEALMALVSEPPKRYNLRNRLSDLVSLLPIDVPQDVLHDLSMVSYLESLPTHTADAGIYYQEDSSRATEHLRAALRVTKWVQEQLEEKIKSN